MQDQLSNAKHDLYLLIPGIMGSVLTKDGQNLWANTG
jgi:hypothetical protein